MTAHFDLCIIGTGSGNSIVDNQFDDWSVAIVERGTFGGTCLNVGCIPSKMLIYPADICETINHAERLGIDASIDNVRWTDIRDRTFGRIDPIAEGGRQYRHRLPNVTVYECDARFVGPKTLQVGEEQITADRFVLAAGARSYIPPIHGLSEIDYHTSDTIMRIDEVPKRLAIFGAGFIAAEMGHVFSAFGSDVTIIMRGEQMLRQQDHEISRRITEHFVERMNVVKKATKPTIKRSGGCYLIEVDTGDPVTIVEADAILVATGRIPNGSELNVEATGVKLDQHGYVITDQTLATDVEGIWALGDIRNPLQLKHLANHEARIVQHNILHPESPKEIVEKVVPAAVFTNPQIGSVGLTEFEAAAAGYEVATTVKEYGGTAYGWAMEDETSCAKLVGDVDTRMLLGAHIIGPQASILIQQLVQGMRFDQTVDEMARDVIYPHPALSEVVENALLDLAHEMNICAETRGPA